MKKSELRDFLEIKYRQYSGPEFIPSDPIQIPHSFTKKQDREISGLLAATLAWGQRKTIINNARRLMSWMDHAPHDFILHHTEKDLEIMKEFVHRTFNFDDLSFFLRSLQNIYTEYPSLEHLFLPMKDEKNLKNSIGRFRSTFLQTPHLLRSRKHLSDPFSNSACKRLNMFLRWMVRRDDVDFGIWENISPALLSCPLDVHSGRVARKLNLLNRKQDDWKAVQELDNNLRNMDANDPVKYDFALYGLGVFEKF